MHRPGTSSSSRSKTSLFHPSPRVKRLFLKDEASSQTLTLSSVLKLAIVVSHRVLSDELFSFIAVGLQRSQRSPLPPVAMWSHSLALHLSSPMCQTFEQCRKTEFEVIEEQYVSGRLISATRLYHTTDQPRFAVGRLRIAD